MTDFVIGCTHFGHANIIRLAGRPFSSVEEMDDVMISNWNSVVSPRDTVYHLGDFAFRGAPAAEYERRLNGRIFKIGGNHDDDGWGVPYHEVRLNRTRIVLMHYPIEEWNGWFRGAVHLHAHTHKHDFVSAERRGNAGADAVGFTPMRLADALEILAATSTITDE